MTTTEKIISILLVVIIVFAFVLQPYFEARTYEKLTGKHVTFWDAVWCDLRIQEQVK